MLNDRYKLVIGIDVTYC